MSLFCVCVRRSLRFLPASHNPLPDSLKKDVSTVERAILSLSQVFLDCAKKAVQESDFKTGLNDLGFADDQVCVLTSQFRCV